MPLGIISSVRLAQEKKGFQGPQRKKQGSSSIASYKPLSQECGVLGTAERGLAQDSTSMSDPSGSSAGLSLK